MTNKLEKTYWAKIYLGLKECYDGEVLSEGVIFSYLQNYCEMGFSVNVQKTNFIYTGGREPGLIIELINYPRFPLKPRDIQRHAFDIANDLKWLAGQQRLSVMMPDSTILVEQKELTLSGLKRIFPSLFKPCMDMSINPGWYDIVWDLSKELSKFDGIETLQIKQKFGGLRYYTQGLGSEVEELINSAEDEASKTCEFCGSRVNVSVRGSSWLYNMCDNCFEND